MMNNTMTRFLIAIMLLAVTSTFAFADESAQMGRRTFSMSGEFIEFVPFSFTVPSGNCGNVKMKQLIVVSGSNSAAYWQELTPGSHTADSGGVFGIDVSDASCSPEFMLEGKLPPNASGWTGLDIKREDLDALTGLEKTSNHFNLPDSKQFSYALVVSRYGHKYILNHLFDYAGNRNSGIQPAGTILVGAILPNVRGYLSQKIFYPDNVITYSVEMLKACAGENIIHDDQIVVLIYHQEHHQ